jgi:hypothetical protein
LNPAAEDEVSLRRFVLTVTQWAVFIVGLFTGILSFGDEQNSSLDPRQQAIEKAYSSPIDFWGKVVDEDGRPIPGVTVTFTIDDFSSAFQDDKPQTTALSDANGLFSLTGKKGVGLQVSVSKSGYYSTGDRSGADLNYLSKASENRTSFFRGGTKEPFPTRSQPTIFVLAKRGAPTD